jgi:CDGSH-type Zn-finger protein/uncharacterized Fe-S cluster protein YjdI
MTLPPRFTPVKSREILLGMLAEAAEIEHNLMCCYLYAAFSMKDSVDEDLSDDELGAVRQWRRTIMQVAIEEMGHLTMVSNIMSAIGGAPHFGRPNFPIAAGYHPSGIVVKLTPFNAETLDHFIYLERPDGVQIADGHGFEPPVVYARGQDAGRIMPSAQDYETVGQLYAAIARGLAKLSETLGEASLFCGSKDQQLGHDVVALPGVAKVLCLKTALEAIDHIVLQGEGSPDGGEQSHYQKFLDVRTQFRTLKAKRATFVPARPAAHNPLMRRPPDGAGKTWVSASPAAEILDVSNAAYNQMLKLLGQAYFETRGHATQSALVDAAIELMYAISPLASLLTQLPAEVSNSACTAGMSFATVRTTSVLPVGPASDAVLVERLDEILGALRPLENGFDDVKTVTARLERLNKKLARALANAPAQTQDKSMPPPPSSQISAPPVPVRNGDVEDIAGKELTLHFNAKRCIHARHCVLGLPGVFKANVEGPWIDPDATSTESLVTVAHMCPSGAIQYSRLDGEQEEATPSVNLIQLRENGPLGFRGDLRLNDENIGMRATLCRCGESKNKPYCDGSHNDIAFEASGEPKTRASEPLAVRNGPVEIYPEPNGPLAVTGNLEVCAGTGRTIDRVTKARLCRCGQSANKPFCDNSHERVGFVAP